MAIEVPEGDRLVLHLDHKSPIEVTELTSSFAALARLYERHYRTGGEPAPKLFITKLETGSTIAEIAPYLVIMGQVVTSMDTSLIVTDFSNRLIMSIRAFADPSSRSTAAVPTKDDAADLREFVKPLAGRKGASLGVRHARFRKTEGDREMVAEYIFDEAEINRATINMDHAIEQASLPEMIGSPTSETVGIEKEVTLVFDQASRKPGKESGKTGDRGLIAQLHPRALPVYFRKAADNLKDQMVRSDVNPLTNNAYVVDVHVVRVDGEPKAFIVTDLHAILPLDD